MDMIEMNEGTLFKFYYDQNAVYQRLNIVYTNDKIETVMVKRVLFYMDGKWHVDYSNTQERCNPYYEPEIVNINVNKHTLEKTTLCLHPQETYEIPQGYTHLSLEIDTSNCYYQGDSPSYNLTFYDSTNKT